MYSGPYDPHNAKEQKNKGQKAPAPVSDDMDEINSALTGNMGMQGFMVTNIHDSPTGPVGIEVTDFNASAAPAKDSPSSNHGLPPLKQQDDLNDISLAPLSGFDSSDVPQVDPSGFETFDASKFDGSASKRTANSNSFSDMDLASSASTYDDASDSTDDFFPAITGGTTSKHKASSRTSRNGVQIIDSGLPRATSARTSQAPSAFLDSTALSDPALQGIESDHVSFSAENAAISAIPSRFNNPQPSPIHPNARSNDALNSLGAFSALDSEGDSSFNMGLGGALGRSHNASSSAHNMTVPQGHGMAQGVSQDQGMANGMGMSNGMGMNHAPQAAGMAPNGAMGTNGAMGQGMSMGANGGMGQGMSMGANGGMGRGTSIPYAPQGADMGIVQGDSMLPPSLTNQQAQDGFAQGGFSQVQDAADDGTFSEADYYESLDHVHESMQQNFYPQTQPRGAFKPTQDQRFANEAGAPAPWAVPQSPNSFMNATAQDGTQSFQGQSQSAPSSNSFPVRSFQDDRNAFTPVAGRNAPVQPHPENMQMQQLRADGTVDTDFDPFAQPAFTAGPSDNGDLYGADSSLLGAEHESMTAKGRSYANESTKRDEPQYLSPGVHSDRDPESRYEHLNRTRTISIAKEEVERRSREIWGESKETEAAQTLESVETHTLISGVPAMPNYSPNGQVQAAMAIGNPLSKPMGAAESSPFVSPGAPLPSARASTAPAAAAATAAATGSAGMGADGLGTPSATMGAAGLDAAGTAGLSAAGTAGFGAASTGAVHGAMPTSITEDNPIYTAGIEGDKPREMQLLNPGAPSTLINGLAYDFNKNQSEIQDGIRTIMQEGPVGVSPEAVYDNISKEGLNTAVTGTAVQSNPYAKAFAALNSTNANHTKISGYSSALNSRQGKDPEVSTMISHGSAAVSSYPEAAPRVNPNTAITGNRAAEFTQHAVAPKSATVLSMGNKIITDPYSKFNQAQSRAAELAERGSAFDFSFKGATSGRPMSPSSAAINRKTTSGASSTAGSAVAAAFAAAGHTAITGSAASALKGATPVAMDAAAVKAAAATASSASAVAVTTAAAGATAAGAGAGAVAAAAGAGAVAASAGAGAVAASTGAGAVAGAAPSAATKAGGSDISARASASDPSASAAASFGKGQKTNTNDHTGAAILSGASLLSGADVLSGRKMTASSKSKVDETSESVKALGSATAVDISGFAEPWYTDKSFIDSAKSKDKPQFFTDADSFKPKPKTEFMEVNPLEDIAPSRPDSESIDIDLPDLSGDGPAESAGDVKKLQELTDLDDDFLGAFDHTASHKKGSAQEGIKKLNFNPLASPVGKGPEFTIREEDILKPQSSTPASAAAATAAKAAKHTPKDLGPKGDLSRSTRLWGLDDTNATVDAFSKLTAAADKRSASSHDDSHHGSDSDSTATAIGAATRGTAAALSSSRGAASALGAATRGTAAALSSSRGAASALGAATRGTSAASAGRGAAARDAFAHDAASRQAAQGAAERRAAHAAMSANLGQGTANGYDNDAAMYDGDFDESDFIAFASGQNDLHNSFNQADDNFDHHMQPHNPALNLNNYLLRCRSAIGQCLYLVQSGLSLDVIDGFNLGYDAYFKTDNHAYGSYNPLRPAGSRSYPALIIPLSADSYVAYNIQSLPTQAGPGADEPVHHYIGKSNGFNLQVLDDHEANAVFICAGELDALAMLSLGQQALAIGTPFNAIHVLEHLQQMFSSGKLSTHSHTTFYICLPQQEKQWKDAAEALQAGMSAFHLNAHPLSLHSPYKSIHQSLVADRSALQDKLNKLREISEVTLQEAVHANGHQGLLLSLQSLAKLELSAMMYTLSSPAAALSRLVMASLIENKHRSILYAGSKMQWQMLCSLLSFTPNGYDQHSNSYRARFLEMPLDLNPNIMDAALFHGLQAASFNGLNNPVLMVDTFAYDLDLCSKLSPRLAQLSVEFNTPIVVWCSQDQRSIFEGNSLQTIEMNQGIENEILFTTLDSSCRVHVFSTVTG